MDTTVLMMGVGFFLAVAVGTLVVLDYAGEKRALRRTLHGVQTAGMGTSLGPRQEQLDLPFFGRVFRPAAGRAAHLGRRLSPAETYERIEKDLVLAGNPAGWDVERILAMKIIVPIVAGVGSFLLAQAVALPMPLPVLFPVLFTAAGWYVPEWSVRGRAQDRQKQIQRTLPDTLDLMSITVEAGLSFDAALSRVSRNIKGPLGQELYRVLQEIQLGKTRGEALRDLSDRTDIQDLRSFIAAMVQADAFGIPIARVLKVQSREIRIRRRQRAEEQAQKLPVKIVFPVVLTIFPALFVILLGPAAIEIYNNIIVG